MNQIKTKRHLVILILGLLILFIPAAVFAQGADPTDDEVNAIAKQIYCPVCENIPLDACGTVACEQWRGIIRDKLKEGWSEDQIKEFFVAQYGDRVLAEPPRRGFNWLIYIIPLLAFVVGGIMLYRGFVIWRGAETAEKGESSQPSQSSRDEPSGEYLQRVEEELQKRSRGGK
jgi:cytochrome c-type biogenesis protein CcmH